MAQSTSRVSDRLLMRVAAGVIVLFIGWIVLGWLLSALFALVRVALLVGLLAIVGWFVLIGPPGMDDD